MDPLQHAIELIKQGKSNEAQNLLKPLIAKDHHDITAWFWFVETCSTHEQRIEVLEICLKYNPDNEQVQQALSKLKDLSITEVNEKKQTASNLNSSISPLLSRLSTLLITFGIALAITPLAIIVAPSIGPHEITAASPTTIPPTAPPPNAIISVFIIVYSILAIFGIPAFPSGLMAFVFQTQDVLSWNSLALGWFIYVVIFLSGVFTKQQTIFKIIYLVFILLLIINIAGCAVITPTILKNIN